MDGQMKKGVLEMCVLFEISKKEVYGYELLKTIGGLFPEIDRSTVYGVLRRLNADGKTESRKGSVSGGPPRKYYRITEKGQAALRNSIREWHLLRNAAAQLGIPE